MCNFRQACDIYFSYRQELPEHNFFKKLEKFFPLGQKRAQLLIWEFLGHNFLGCFLVLVPSHGKYAGSLLKKGTT